MKNTLPTSLAKKTFAAAVALAISSSNVTLQPLVAATDAPSPALPLDTPPPPLPSAKDLSGFSKTKLRDMLARIEREPAPAIVKVNAMCYAPLPEPERAEYVCPTCGQKTIYAHAELEGSDQEKWETFHYVQNDLDHIRRLLKQIQRHTLSVSLIENVFCNHCQPSKKKPRPAVLVRFDDGTSKLTSNITPSDFEALLAFFAGRLKIKTSDDSIYPLKGEKTLRRLKVLLGEISETEAEKEIRRESEEQSQKGAAEKKSPDSDYVVVAGDTGYGVAKKHGMSFAELKDLNSPDKLESLRIGQKLRVRQPK
jgi:hypothetical protein